MSDSHDHHGDPFKAYMFVAVALSICTASSFFVNQFISHSNPVLGFLLILGVAIIKAVLVGWIFMHLKWDWKLLYFIIVPVSVLGVMMAIVFLPDGIVGPRTDAQEDIVIAKEFLEKSSKGR